MTGYFNVMLVLQSCSDSLQMLNIKKEINSEEEEKGSIVKEEVSLEGSV